MRTVDIDIGGTLTDGILIDGSKLVCIKVDTTPHDLTVCLFDCLSQGAAQLGYVDVDAFLEETELIRWSTTITSNVLAECHGPRIGLLVSRGHESDLYGAGRESVAVGRIVSRQDILGVEASTSETDIMNAVRSLLESGVRRICVSLKGSHRDAEPEIRIKRIIDQQYPDHFLGSVPVLAGSDISKSADDMTRTHCALINAYTHGALAATLFKAEDELRETHRYAGTFLVSHSNGGGAGIAKTKAIDTIESGPILGIQGSAHLARVYGIKDIVALDVGGTTAKVSVLRNSEPVQVKPSNFFGIPVELSLPYLRSIALGGGSVVKAAPGQTPEIALGPESMGSFPGPACYGLGGDQATLTDAFVAAGLINPDYFLGGMKPIQLETARKTIDKMVARPLKKTVEEAARGIIHRAFDSVASLIGQARRELAQGSGRHTLFAFGGNGGLFACGVAEKAEIEEVWLFALGPVFSAFGSSVSDIAHVYERFFQASSFTDDDLARLRRILEEMKAEGVKDLLGEGVKPEKIKYSVELEVSRDGQPAAVVACTEAALERADALRAHIQSGTGAGSTRWETELVRLQMKKAMPKPSLVQRHVQGADSSQASKGKRRVAWGSKSGEARIYRWESLEPGNRVEGCAVFEGENSTYFVPEGWALELDRYGNAKVTRR